MPRFTAIVVTWNSAAEIPALVDSVELHLGDRCELLFVDNASSDGTGEVIRSRAPAATVISLPENAGFGAACNIGVREARTDVVCLLNPDTVMVDDSLYALGELALGERAIFAPLLLNEDGTPQIGARPPLGGWESLLLALWPGALMPQSLRVRCEPWRFPQRLSVGWISGACIVARRELLLDLGPFDERYFQYGEDLDLSLRARRAGVPVVSAGDVAQVVHLGGRSAAQAYADHGMQSRIEASRRVAREQLGPTRLALDRVTQLLAHGSRWVVKRALRRDTSVQAGWLRAPRSRRFARMSRPRTLRNAWFATRYVLGSHTATYPLLRFAPAPYARVMVEKGMDACIDALPRSANTFGGTAFLRRNPNVRLAHHMHLPEQVARAVRLEVPCVVLLRDPLSTLTSLVIAGENDLSHDLAFRVYIDYYRRIARLRDRIALCTFEEVLDDPAVIARRLNDFCGTNFDTDPFDAAAKQEIVELLERDQAAMNARPAHVTVPTEYKERLKPEVRKALAAHRFLPQAEAAYRVLVDELQARG